MVSTQLPTKACAGDEGTPLAEVGAVVTSRSCGGDSSGPRRNVYFGSSSPEQSAQQRPKRGGPVEAGLVDRCSTRAMDSDLTRREARAYTAAVQRGVIPAAGMSRADSGGPMSSSHRHLRVAVDRALCLDANVKYSDAFTVVSTALQPRTQQMLISAILAGDQGRSGRPESVEKLLLEAAALRPTSPGSMAGPLRLSTTGLETPRRRPMPEPELQNLKSR